MLVVQRDLNHGLGREVVSISCESGDGGNRHLRGSRFDDNARMRGLSEKPGQTEKACCEQPPYHAHSVLSNRHG